MLCSVGCNDGGDDDVDDDKMNNVLKILVTLFNNNSYGDKKLNFVIMSILHGMCALEESTIIIIMMMMIMLMIIICYVKFKWVLIGE